jgi:small subunit ribosomal protein S1
VITEFGENGRNLVVSRRKELERESAELAAKVWDTISEGDVFEGTVTSVQSYGAFVDIGGVDGLVHVSEISHIRVADPREVLTKGQKVTVTVVSIDSGAKRIGLSIKNLEDDPWLEASDKFIVGARATGKVTRLAQFGAFVELLPGVEGLVHISRLSPGKRVQNVRDVVKPGDEVTVEVIEFDAGRRRMSLAVIDLEGEAEQEAVGQFMTKQQHVAPKSMGTFGDLLAKKAKK